MKEFEKNKNEFLIFLKKDRGYSDQTIQSYSRDLNVYSNFIQENKLQYNKIKKDDIFKFQSSLEGQINPRSFARVLSALKTFYKFLHMERVIDDITLNEIKSYPSPKYKKSMPTFLSKEQVEKIVEKINLNENLDDRSKKRDQAIIMLFFSSGIRLNELISIKLSDIDFSNNKIKVFGKGKKQRIVNFDNYTKDLIIEYLKIIEKYPLAKELYNNNLFVNKKNKALKERKVQTIVMNNLKQLNLASYGPHTLRHSFATHLLNSALSINAIQSLLGHESLSSTQIYTHVTLGNLKETIKKAHPRGEK